LEQKKRDHNGNKSMKPWSVFLSLVFLNLILGCIVYLFPSDGVKVNDDFSLNFVSFDELLDKKETIIVDLEEVLEGVETLNEDTTIIVAAKVETPKNLLPFRRPQKKIFSKWFTLPDSNPDIISSLLLRIKEESKDKVVRILHYGDSQLEGDRITNYLRNRLQKKFGGCGPGILLPLEPTASSRGNFRVSQSDDFMKHSIYTKTTYNDSFGIGGAAFTIQNPTPNKALLDTVNDSSEIQIEKSRLTSFDKSFLNIKKMYMGYSRSRKYSKAKLLFSNSMPFQVKLSDNDSIQNCTIPASSLFGVKEWDVNNSNNFKLSFNSENYPIIYGLALDGDTGVAVDNFPMRGSSGTGFSKINRSMYAAQLSKMNVAAIILQFGVNIIPDVRDNYDYYKRWFSNQLNSIHSANPDVTIIVIGPSDMSRNQEGEMVSYENIPLIRDAMKNAAIENDCCFWDLYEAMGGENSMSAWVKDDLAQKDYTHFTFKGAKFVSEMLYKSIIEFE
jgi:lysophospholipase L1-like esterase